jgi:hypothetical protein
MNKEIKAHWIAKLREEGRRQTGGTLRDASGAQCCLGVLCEVAIEDGVIEAPTLPEGAKHYEYRYTTDEGHDLWEAALLPGPVWRWAGLYDSNPDVGSRAAAYLNDDLNYTFPEIADAIEADEEL